MKRPSRERRRGAAPLFATPFDLKPIACCVMAACSGGAWANPTGPQVAAGSVQMQGLGSNQLRITNTPNSIINWQAFSIGAGQSTQFIQQSPASAVLNRVVGADISQINGQLISNGRVFLVNPAGIVIGPGGVIDTAGFVGSALNMLDRDFLAGRLRFEGGDGSVRNAGFIRSSENILLVGQTVENSGLIRSANGSVVLAAGRSVTIASPRLEGVQFTVQAPADAVINLGTIEAKDAVGLFAGTLHHSGDVRAGGLDRNTEGRVVLSAQKDVTVDAGAKVSVSGANGGNVTIKAGDTALVSGSLEARGTEGKGGFLGIFGKLVGLLDGARADASGKTGGGTVLIGGDMQGKNAAVMNAWRTFVGRDVEIRADAMTSGDGGKVIVWADDITRFGGAISARGGAQGGNGGFAEVSGKRYLDFRGTADLRAPFGRAGTLLLDPTDINIVAGGVGGSSTQSAFGGGTTTFQDTTPAATSQITTGDLDNALSLGNVAITTTSGATAPNNGDISFNAAFNMTGSSLTRTLTLSANHDININNPISVSAGNQLSVVLNAANVSNINANVSLGGGVLDANTVGSRVVNMSSGTPTISNVSTFNVGTLNIGAATATLDGATTAGTLNLTSGTGVLTGSGNVTVTSAFSRTAGSTISTGGDLSITQAAGQLITSGPISASRITLSAAGGITADDLNSLSGGIALNSTAGAGDINLNGGLRSDTTTVVSNATPMIEVRAGGNLAVRGDVKAFSYGGVMLQAGNDIAYDYTAGVNTTHVLTAVGNVSLTATNGRLYRSGVAAGNLNFLNVSGAAVTYSANGALETMGTVAASGPLSLTSSANVIRTTAGAMSASSGNVTLNAVLGIDAGAITAGAGTITLSSTGAAADVVFNATVEATNTGLGPTTPAIDASSGRALYIRNADIKANTSGGVRLLAGGELVYDNTVVVNTVNVLTAPGNVSLTSTNDRMYRSGTALGNNNVLNVSGAAVTYSANGALETMGTVAASGPLSLTSLANVIRTTAGAMSATAGDVTLNAATGIDAGAITAGAGKITLTSTGAAADVAIGGTLEATNTGLAPTTPAIDVSSARDLFTRANLTANTTGGIRLQSANTIQYDNTAGPNTINTITAAGNVQFTATGGSIFRSGVAAGRNNVLNISGAGVALNAGGSITPMGNTIVASAGDLTMSAVTGITPPPLTASDGKIILTSTGAASDIFLNATLEATNTGLAVTTPAIDVSSGRAISIGNADIKANTSGGVRLLAGGELVYDNTVVVNTVNVLTAPGNVSLTSTNDRLYRSGVAAGNLNFLNVSGAAVTYSANGALETMGTVAASGPLSLTSSANVIRTTAGAMSASSGNVTLNAVLGIDAGAITAGAGTITLSSTGAAADVVFNATVEATNTGLGPTTPAIDASSGRALYIRNADIKANTSGGVRLLAGGELVYDNTVVVNTVNVLTAPGNVSLTSTNDRMYRSGTALGNNNVLNVSGAAVTYSANGALETMGTVAASGPLSLTSLANVIRTTAGAMSATAGDVTLNAATGIDAGAITAGAGKITLTSTGAAADVAISGTLEATNTGLGVATPAIDVSSGRALYIHNADIKANTSGGVRLLASGELAYDNTVVVNTVNVLTAPGNVSLTSTNDRVYRSGTAGGNNNVLNITGGSVALNAGAAIENLGTTSATGNVTLTAGSLIGSGGAPMGIGTVGGVVNATTTGGVGDINLRSAASPFTLGTISTPAGINAVNVQVAGGPNDLTIGSAITSDDNISFSAARNLIFAGGASITANSLALAGASAKFDAGTVNLNAPVTSTAPFAVGGATVNLNASASAPSLNIASGAVSVNTGQLQITTGDVTNSGTLNLKGSGSAPTMTVAGNLLLNASSVFGVELGGTASTAYGNVAVTGSATLNGTLNVTHAPGFDPSAGNTFTIMSYASNPGTDFTTKNFVDLFTYAAAPGAGAYTVQATAVPVIWTGGAADGGLWQTGGNWRGGAAPTASDNALIRDVGAPGISETITVSAGGQAAARLSSAENLLITGGLTLGTGASAVNATLTVNNGAVGLGGPLTAARLDLLSGGISGNGALTVGGAFNASGGSITGGGLFTTNGTSTISNSVTVFSNWTNTGTVNLNNGQIGMSAGSPVFTNSGAVNIATTDANPFSSNTSASIVNSGTIAKTSAGVSTINPQFTNQGGGNVNVDDGTLRFAGAGTHAGTFTVASGKTLEYSDGSIAIAPGSSLTGGGRYLLSNSVLDVTGGSLPKLEMTGGTLTRSTAGDVTIGGAFDVSGGVITLTGGGGLITQGATTVTNTVTVFSNWTNSGTLALNGGRIAMSAGSPVFTNTGTVNLATTDTNPFSTNNSASIVSSGAINKNSAGVSEINTQFTNQGAGTVTVNDGTLRFTGTSSNAGTFTAAAAKTFEFSSGTMTIAPGATLSGAGRYLLSGGTLDVTGGSLPRLEMTSGVFTRSTAGDVTIGGAFDVSGGTVNFAGGGALVTQGTTTVTNTVNVFSNWTNSGTLDLNGGRIGMSAGLPVFTNTGTVNLATTDTNPFSTNSSASIVSSGAINKNSAGVSEINTQFTNQGAGTVTVNDGTLRFTGTSTNAGTFTVAASKTFEFLSGTMTIAPGATLSGAGRYLLSGGTLDVTGGSLPKLEMTSGTLTRSTAGDVTISGAYDVSGGTITLTGGGGLVTQGTTTVTNTVNVFSNWAQNGTLDLTAGQVSMGAGTPVLTNTGTVNIASTDGNPFGTNSSSAISNGGTINKNAAGSAVFDGTFTNLAAGVLNVNSGVLQLRFASDSQAGRVEIGAGAQLSTNDRSLTNAATGIIGGGGTLNLGPTRTLTNDGTLRPGLVSGDTTGMLSITGNLSQGAGALVNVELGGAAAGDFDVLAISGSAALAGTLNVSRAGGFAPVVGDTFNILTYASRTGDFLPKNFPADFTFSAPPGAITYPVTVDTVTNTWIGLTGTWQTAANWRLNRVPAATDDVVIPDVGAAGISDTVTVSAAGQAARTITVAENFAIASGALTLGAGSSMTSAGLTVSGGTLTTNGALAASTLTMSAGTLTGTGAVTVSGAFNWSGGNITGGGLLTTGAASTTNVTGFVSLTDKAWDNFGGVTMSGDSRITLAGNALPTTFTNKAGGIFTETSINATPVNASGSSAKSLVNEGTFNRNATATAVREISAPFSNNGMVNVNAGTLALSGGGTDTGAYVIATGTTLESGGGGTTRNFNAGAALSGTGTFTLSGGTLAVNNALTVANGGPTVQMSGGTLNGAAALSLNGGFNWSGGNITGGGLLTTGATSVTSVTGFVNLTDKAWDNFGGATMSGDSRITLAGNALPTTFTNKAGGIFTETSVNATPVNASGSSAKSFVNEGTFNRNATATAVREIATPFSNSGTVNVNAGTLMLSGGGTDTGTYDIDPGATLQSNGGTRNVNAGVVLSGTGTFALSGGTLRVNNALTVANGGPTVQVSGGTLDGIAAVTLNSGFNWSAGDITGGGLFTTGPTSITNVTGFVNLTDKVWENFGGVTMSGDSRITLAGNAAPTTFTNKASGIFTETSINATPVNPSGSSAKSFVNEGTFNRNASATAVREIATSFSNSGTVNVNAGTLVLSGGGADAGAYDIDPGTTLQSSGGTRNVNAGVALTGAGTFALTGGTLRVNNALTVATSGPTVQMSGGTLNGVAAVTLNSGFNWSAGNITGGGLFTTGATLATSVTGFVNLTDKAWENFGGVTMSGDSRITLAGNALPTTFTNKAGGIFTETSVNATPVNASGSSAKSFVNEGTFIRNATATAVREISAPFMNSGTVNVNAGTLALIAFPTNAGTVNVAGSATLSTSNNNLTNTGTIGGEGTLDLASATLTNNGTLRPGAATGDTTGTLSITGNLTNGAGGQIDVELGGTVAGAFDVVAVSGNANLNGTLNLTSVLPYAATSGDSFTVITAGGTRSGTFAAINPTFANSVTPAYNPANVVVTLGPAGAVVWDGGGGNTDWTNPLNWSTDALPQAANDVRVPELAGVQTISIGAAAHTVRSMLFQGNEGLSITGGSLTFSQASSMPNSTLALSGGALNANGNLLVQTLNVAGGSLASGGNLTVTGALNYSAGAIGIAAGKALTLATGSVSTWTAPNSAIAGGALQLQPNSTLSVTGAGTRQLSATTVDNRGNLVVQGAAALTLDNAAALDNNSTATWNSSAPVTVNAGSTLTNNGTLNLNATATNTGIVGAGTVRNNSILNSIAGGFKTLISTVFNNAGTTSVQGGTLTLSGNGADTGTYTMGAATTLEVAGGTRNLDAGAAVNGTGTLTVSGGALNVNTPITIANPVVLTGGNAVTLGGTGNLTLSGPFAWSQGADIAGTGTLTTSGTTTISDTSNGVAKNWTNTGTVDMTAGSGLEFFNVAATITNQGTFNLPSAGATPISVSSGGGAIANQGTFNKAGAGTQSILNTAFTNAANATLNVSAGTLAIPDLNSNAGLIALTNGATLTTNGVNGIDNTGTIAGNGTVDVGAGKAVVNRGVLRPGTSAGILNITGDLVLASAGTAQIEVQGPGPGTGHDVINVSGQVRGAPGNTNDWGTLAITQPGGAQPAAGTSFPILNYASRQGDFSTKSFPSGFDYTAMVTGTTYSLFLDSVTNSWILAGSGNWGDPLNWSLGHAPNGGERARIDVPGGPFTVTLPGGALSTQRLDSSENLAVTGGSLTLAGPSTIGAALIVSGGTLQGAGAVSVSGPLNFSGGTIASAGGVTANGGATWTGGTLTGPLTVPAFTTLDIAGASAKNLSGAAAVLTNNGITTIGGSGSLSLDTGAVFMNGGVATWNGPAPIVLGTGTSLVNTPAGTFNLASAGTSPAIVFSGGGAIVNQGTFDKSNADTQTIATGFTNAAGGALRVNGGTLAIPALNANAGLIMLRNGATLTTNGVNGIDNTGTIGGNGTIDLGGQTLTNSGYVRPGQSPGTLSIVGDYVQTPAGTLAIEIGGMQPGVDFDLLRVSGIADLGGTLQADTVSGFTPHMGDVFNFMTYSTKSGDFSAIVLPSGPTQAVANPASYEVSLFGSSSAPAALNSISRPGVLTASTSTTTRVLTDQLFAVVSENEPPLDQKPKQGPVCK